MDTKFPTWGGVDTAALVVSGLLVVFAALIVIIAFIWVLGKIMSGVESKKAQKKQEVTAKAAPAPTVKAPAAVAPVETDGVSDEVVVAISSP